jgi:hypothetical protein
VEQLQETLSVSSIAAVRHCAREDLARPLEYITRYVEATKRFKGLKNEQSGVSASNHNNIPRHAPPTPLRAVGHAAIRMADRLVLYGT